MVRVEKDCLHVSPQDEFTIYQAEECANQIVLLISSVKSLHVNLSSIDKIDTAGFQILVALKKSCEAFNIPMEIEGLQGSSKNFMELLGFNWENEIKERA